MSKTPQYNTDKIWNFLSEIPDPEIPVITIAELGVLRNVELLDNTIIVTITPTYSGCPAMKAFEDDIKSALQHHNIESFEVKTVHSPAWTTDWMTEKARTKLKNFGIAPPIKGTQDKGVLFEQGPKEVQCPQCGSNSTKLVSQFGSTACKALYNCETCKEPFDYFKCI